MSTIAIADQRTATPAVRTRLRITRRGRIVLTTLVALPVFVIVALSVLNGGQASAETPPAPVSPCTSTP